MLQDAAVKSNAVDGGIKIVVVKDRGTGYRELLTKLILEFQLKVMDLMQSAPLLLTMMLK